MAGVLGAGFGDDALRRSRRVSGLSPARNNLVPQGGLKRRSIDRETGKQVGRREPRARAFRAKLRPVAVHRGGNAPTRPSSSLPEELFDVQRNVLGDLSKERGGIGCRSRTSPQGCLKMTDMADPFGWTSSTPGWGGRQEELCRQSSRSISTTTTRFTGASIQ